MRRLRKNHMSFENSVEAYTCSGCNCNCTCSLCLGCTTTAVANFLRTQNNNNINQQRNLNNIANLMQ